MTKTPPTKLQLATIVVFVTACVFLLIYLWIAFGGSSPLAAKGYRIKVAFAQANELATGASVRVAGVDVGSVVALSPDLHDNRTLATLQIAPRYAPIPRDANAMLRIKTLLGETYVQLGWTSRRGGSLPDGGRLPDGQVAPTVDLDQILSTFDPRTRRAFQIWLQAQAAAVNGRGTDINTTLAELPGFVGSTTQLTSTLDAQRSALAGLVAHTGTFFAAVSARRGQLAGFITGGNRLFSTTAARNEALSQLFQALPAFERQSRLTLPALTRLGDQADPTVRALTSLAPQLTTAFSDSARFAPQLRAVFDRLGPLARASRAGLPAADEILARIPPLTGAFIPFLRDANPIVSYIGLFKPEIAGFFANVAAATEGFDDNALRTSREIHYLRASQTLAPAGLAFGGASLGSDRNDAYRTPGAYAALAHGLATLDPAQCSAADPGPPTTGDPSLAALVAEYVFRSTTATVAAPACRAAGDITGFVTRFPHLTAEPPPGVR